MRESAMKRHAIPCSLVTAPWYAYGSPIVVSRHFHDIPIAPHGTPMVFLWLSRGIPMTVL